MGAFTELVNNLRYRLTYHRVTALPPDEQRKIGHGIYSDIYTGMSKRKGEATGGVTVQFQCDYDGHVSYYLRNLLESRCKNEDDCTITWVLESVDVDGDGIASPSEYELTVVARAEDATAAALAAEASAMSAILSIPTVYGALQRSLFETKQITLQTGETGDVN